MAQVTSLDGLVNRIVHLYSSINGSEKRKRLQRIERNTVRPIYIFIHQVW